MLFVCNLKIRFRIFIRHSLTKKSIQPHTLNGLVQIHEIINCFRDFWRWWE